MSETLEDVLARAQVAVWCLGLSAEDAEAVRGLPETLDLAETAATVLAAAVREHLAEQREAVAEALGALDGAYIEDGLDGLGHAFVDTRTTVAADAVLAVLIERGQA